MPHSGKSTILNRLIAKSNPKVGFVTNEVRQRGGVRIGFEMKNHTHAKLNLANCYRVTNIKVSKYYVNLNWLNRMIEMVTDFYVADLLFLDEIGQMQLYSDNFKALVLKYLDADNICLATMSMVYDDEFISQIKRRDDVILVEITPENRAAQFNYLKTLITKIIKAKKYTAQNVIKGDRAIVHGDHGVRNLAKTAAGWVCDCDFYNAHKICSHTISLS